MLSRFKHVLLPLDFTPKNEAAIAIALDLAAANQGRVLLAHVIERVQLPDDDELQAFYGQLENRAKSSMAVTAERFAEAGIPIECQVLFGRRPDEIVQLAESEAVDMIVMSSHPVDPTRPMQSWGTVSYQVSLLCTCPVLLVK